MELRKQCGMSNAEVCKCLDWSAGKLHHMESASWLRPSGDDVAELCELYGVEGKERDALIKLARDARQRGWWRRYNDVLGNELPGFEAGASRIRTFECTLIPGLLQSPKYIDYTTKAFGSPDTEIERRKEARLERQKVLVRAIKPVRLHALIDEAALLRLNDADVRAEQVDHLLMIGKRQNVTIEIVPLAAGPYPGNGEVFILLDFPDPADRSLVYVEGATDERFLENFDEIERYTLRFDRIRASALDARASAAHLSRLIE